MSTCLSLIAHVSFYVPDHLSPSSVSNIYVHVPFPRSVCVMFIDVAKYPSTYNIFLSLFVCFHLILRPYEYLSISSPIFLVIGLPAFYIFINTLLRS